MSADLKGALAPKGTRNYPAITDPAKVGVLFRAMEDYEGMPSTSAARSSSGLKRSPSCVTFNV